MSMLYLHCELCGHRQADGLLSRAAWGQLQLGDGRTLRACGPCRSSQSDWEQLLRALAGGGSVSLPGRSTTG